MLAFLNAEGPRREYYYWGTPLSGAYDMMTLSKQATVRSRGCGSRVARFVFQHGP